MRGCYWDTLAPHSALRPFVVLSAGQRSDDAEQTERVNQQLAALGLLPQSIGASGRTERALGTLSLG